MLEVTNMSRDEMVALLLRGRLGHLGCSRDGHPYVVPMHYAYDGECLYFFTTEGTKTEFIAANREVCFQLEEMTDARRWLSVMVFGYAERVTNIEATERNPTLTPALNETKVGKWKRFNNVVVYRVRPHSICGRKTT